MARPTWVFNDGEFRLFRLSDQEFQSLSQHALPIVQNFDLLGQLPLRCSPKGDFLTLGHARVGLERRFGSSSTWYDSYRGSFAFPLLLTFEGKKRKNYLLRCHDYRSILYFPLYRIVSGDPSPAERARYHPPDHAEFPRAEMDDLVATVYGELLTFVDALNVNLVAPFFHAVQSDSLLYGYENGRFFEKTYHTYEEFRKERERLEEHVGPRRPRSSSNRVEEMIARVIAS
jgi:hypothetical protein